MLARCMLPISIVETDGFKDFLHYLDPSFQIPTRRRVKDVGLPAIKLTIQNKIKNVLHNLSWVNTSVDLWTDATTRCFNGYIAQGIDNDWVLQTIPIEFEPMTGI